MKMENYIRKRLRDGTISVCKTAILRLRLYNSRLRLFLGKHKSPWTGLYVIVKVLPFGVLIFKNNKGQVFKVNGSRLKQYWGCEISYPHSFITLVDATSCDA